MLSESWQLIEISLLSFCGSIVAYQASKSNKIDLNENNLNKNKSNENKSNKNKSSENKSNEPKKVDPNWVTGLYNSKGSLDLKISPRKNNSNLFQVSTSLTISVVVSQIQVLYYLQTYFGVGSITVRNNIATFKIGSFKEIMEIVLPHFDKYPLIGYRYSTYVL